MGQGDYFQTSFCFFEKALYEVKVSLVSINFDSPQLGKQ